MNDTLNRALSPLDALLVGFAAGRLGPQEELLVTAARALNPDVRARIAQFETLGARLMCDEAPAPVHADCLSVVMQRIDETPPAICRMSARCAEPPPGLDIPSAVYALINAACAAPPRRWSRLTQGVAHMELRVTLPPQKPQKKLRLMKLAPLQATPRHAHAGTEITLVLHGSFSDELGTFKKGDIVVLTDPRFAHRPQAGEDGCICLTLTESPLRFNDPFARFMNAFWRV